MAETVTPYRTPTALLPSDAYYIAGVLTGTFVALSTGTLTVGRLIAAPFVAPKRLTIDRLGFSVTTVGGSGSKTRCGIYTNTPDTNYPKDLLVDGGEYDTSSVGGTGFKVTTVSLSLEPGVLYWFAALAGTAAPTVKIIDSGSSLMFGFDANFVNRQNGWFVNRTYGALPSTYPGSAVITPGSDNIPAIGIRISAIA